MSSDEPVRISLDEFKQRVTIAIIPEQPVLAHPSGKGGLSGETTFWLHTMRIFKEFGMPELEFRGIPALFVSNVADVLNEWGHYSVTMKPIRAHENIQTGSLLPVILHTTPSPQPYWVGLAPCLSLHVEAVLFECSECGKEQEPQTFH